jgi:tetratricopeptide (TPR) repeat protein
MCSLHAVDLLLTVAFGVGWVGLLVPPSAFAEDPPTAAAKPAAETPARRHLTGEDARRLQELEAKLAKAEEGGRFAEAVEAARRVLEVRRRAQGEGHWEAVSAAWRLKALERVASLPADAQKEWQTLGGIMREADQKEQQVQYAEAQPLLEKALAITRQALGEDHPDTAQSYNNLARNLAAQGKYDEAHPPYEKALAIWRRALGEDHPDTASGYNNVAVNLNAQGKYVEAQPLNEKALAILRKALGEEHALTASGYNNLAYNLNAQGKYAEAQPLYEKALAIRRKALGEDDPNTASSYNNLAYNLNAKGKYAEAQPLYEKALAIRRKALGDDHPNTASSYNNVAANLNAEGKYAEVQPLYEKALAIQRKALGEDHPDTARSYNNLAYNLNAQGKYTEAQPLYEKALAIRRKALREDHPDTAASYNNVASNLHDKGKYTEAQPLYEKALAIRRKTLEEDHPDTAQSYNNLAYNLNAQGKYVEAEAAWTKAAVTFGQARSHFAFTGLSRSARTAEGSPLTALAAVLARNGKPTEAWRRLEENLGRGLFDDLSARQARPLSAEDHARQRDLLARLERLDKLFDNLPAGKADAPELQKRLADLSRQRSTAQAEHSAFEAELVQRYGVAAGEVYDLDAIQKRLPPDTALVAWLDRAGEAHSADPDGEHWVCVVRHLGTPAWVGLKGTGPRDSWTEDDLDLPRQMAAACAAEADPDDRTWKDWAARLTRQRLAPVTEFLAGQTDLPPVKHLVVLPSPSLAGIPVEALLRPQDGYTVSYAPSGTLLAWLLRKGLEPLSPARSQAPALLALADPVFPPAKSPAAGPSPDHGVLVTQVLPDSAAARVGLQKDDVLLKYGNTTLASPEDLVAAIQRTLQTHGGKEVHLAAWRDGKTLDLTVPPGRLGIEFDRRPAPQALKEDREFAALMRSARGGSFDPLPGTRREVRAVALALQTRDKEAAVTTLVGSDANEQRLAELLTGQKPAPYRFIHLATHGVAADRFAMRSALILSQDKLPDPPEQVLHGKPVYDGRLTAAEVMQHWNLDADLVVLSACQSGRGKHEGGEGFVGFAQALLLAGARSVVVSLWKVDDTATALLMQRFYQNLLGSRTGQDKPMPKAEALQEAKHWLRALTAEEAQKLIGLLPPGERGERVKARAAASSARPYAHPHYWAAFILVGDPN